MLVAWTAGAGVFVGSGLVAEDEEVATCGTALTTFSAEVNVFEESKLDDVPFFGALGFFVTGSDSFSGATDDAATEEAAALEETAALEEGTGCAAAVSLCQWAATSAES